MSINNVKDFGYLELLAELKRNSFVSVEDIADSYSEIINNNKLLSEIEENTIKDQMQTASNIASSLGLIYNSKEDPKFDNYYLNLQFKEKKEIYDNLIEILNKLKAIPYVRYISSESLSDIISHKNNLTLNKINKFSDVKYTFDVLTTLNNTIKNLEDNLNQKNTEIYRISLSQNLSSTINVDDILEKSKNLFFINFIVSKHKKEFFMFLEL